MEIIDDYRPNPWQTKFHQSTSRHKLLVGGMGSGKSLAMIQEIKTCALESPGSIWVVGRKTLPSLRDTTLRAFLAAIPTEIVQSFNKASLTLVLKNKSEIWFRPLYDAEILKSYEIAGFGIDEANEVDEEIYNRLKDRMRQRLPNGGRPRYQSILAINPTEEDHWIPQTFLFSKRDGHELFQSTTFDNMENLPPEYIKELETTYSKDVLQRFLYGQFGKVHKGKPVFAQFSRGSYIYPIEFDRRLPLIRGWDFGYNHPACIFMQMEGTQIRVLGEILGKKVYLEDFVDHEVLHYQKNTFPYVDKFLDFCDPHGADKSDKSKTSIQILNERRIFPVYRRTYIAEGIRAIKHALDTKDSHGNPNFLIHPRARILIDGFKGGYHRLDNDENPAKDGYYEHCIEGSQLVETSKGLVPMRDVRSGDWVLTRKGYREVLSQWSNGVKPVFRVTLSDGSNLLATGNHQIFTDRGWLRVDELRYADVCVTRKRCYSTEENTQNSKTKNTGGPTQGPGIRPISTETFGSTTTGRFRRASMSTISTTIETITTSQIWNSLKDQFISLGIKNKDSSTIPPFIKSSEIASMLGLELGTHLRKVEPGTVSTPWLKFERKSRQFARFVKGITSSTPTAPSVPASAEEHAGLVSFAHAEVVSVRLSGEAEVFDLAVSGEHEFFASHVLVHNCFDALRYASLFLLQRKRVTELMGHEAKVYMNPRTGRRIEY